MPGGAATEDTSRSGCLDRTGLRADHRQGRALWLGQAGGQLSGTGTTRRIQRQSATAGAYHQTREFDAALLAGGSGAGHSAQRARVAQPVLPPGDATGGKIAKVAMARRLAVRLYWMMRQGWDYDQMKKFGSHAGQPGHRHGEQ